MGNRFKEIEAHQRIVLHIRNHHKHVVLGATIQKHLKDNFSLIILDYTGSKRLIFQNVKIDVEYCQSNGVPIIWPNAKIITYKNAYVLQVDSEGVRNNRRNAFRVAVAQTAWIHIPDQGPKQILLKDVSLSGFSITDRKKELGLAINNRLSMSFEEWGHKLNLEGRIVRMEEREDMIIYGLAICNMCKDLSPYISLKQRRNKNKKIYIT